MILHLGPALKLVDPKTGECLGVLHVPPNLDLSRVERYGSDKIPLNLPFSVAAWEHHSFNDAMDVDFILLAVGYCQDQPDAFSVMAGKQPHELHRYPGYAFTPSVNYIMSKIGKSSRPRAPTTEPQQRR